jgi:RNA polymerase sigma factor (sigma-70 family)
MGMAEPSFASTACADDLPDDVLLERFTSQREEAAFAVLVRRHGPLVLGVCRRVLQHEQDAEDAFQAVFCVLARRAASICNRGAIGAWLHAVAYRLARKVRAERGRRPVPMPNLPEIPATEESPAWAWRELQPILDEEVNRLPEKYRQVFVLCYLDGRTNEQAAGLLGCPLGTVLSRLARARERLRGRLKRRGLALSGAALVAVLGSEAAGAVVPAGLTQAALHSAVAFTGIGATAGALSSSVSTLSEEFLRGWARARLIRLRLIRLSTGLLAVVVVGVTLLLLLHRPAAAPARLPQTDQQQLQGTWGVTQVETGGVVLPAQGFRIIFAGDQFTLTNPQFRLTMSFQLDPTRTPREITLRSGPVISGVGIYQLEDNSLKICLNMAATDRPSTFSTQGGTNAFLYTLEREAVAPTDPAGPARGP